MIATSILRRIVLPVADSYSWSQTQRESRFRLPGPDRLGWWAAVAMVFSVVLHLLMFFAMDQVKIVFGISPSNDISTERVHVAAVDSTPSEPPLRVPPEATVKPPDNTAPLLDQIDLLQALPKNQDLDVKPNVTQAEYALKMGAPAAKGDPVAAAFEISRTLDIVAELPDAGIRDTKLPPIAPGQIAVEYGTPQTDVLDLTKFTNDLIKKGNNGKIDNGALEGITSLTDMLGLPANEIVAKKTLLPSDLLFEFNSAELKENAKVGLFTLGVLLDKNPGLYCWIEGHTDLIGGEESNLNLSRKRAAAVRNYLVKSMRYDGSKISARGYGRSQPLILEGDASQQAPNRRVEIRFRKTQPVDIPPAPRPRSKSGAPVPPADQQPLTAKPVLVKPNVHYPEVPAPSSAPQAQQVPEPPPIPSALPVPDAEATPEIPQATPVEEDTTLRAQPVDE